MNFTADTWWIMSTAATLAIGIITYFLKRTMSKQDKHEEEINHIKLTYVTKDDLKDVKRELTGTTQFQSTYPIKGMTLPEAHGQVFWFDFNPHTL